MSKTNQLPKKPFCFEEFDKLYTRGMLKDRLDAKNYLLKYFYPTYEANYFYWDADEKRFDIKDKNDLCEVFFNRLGKDMKKFFFEENKALYKVICDIHKPIVDPKNKTINICKRFKYEDVKAFDKYDKETKKNAFKFLKYIEEVLASNNKAEYEYILKWSANMCLGNKNTSVLYLKADQGAGKSTFPKMFYKHILGEDISVSSDSEPLISRFNKILLGHLFVDFNELKGIGKNDWESACERLKSLITEEFMTFEDKNIKKFKARNISNFVITCNHESIKESYGRRIFILSIDPKYIGNSKYWTDFYDTVFNDKVGEALFAYFTQKVDITHFEAQHDMPESRGKLDAISKLLPVEYKFIKDEYILKQLSIKDQPEALFRQYELYCTHMNYKPLHKIDFCQKLRNIGINYFKTNGYNWYKNSYEELKEIADKQKWIHELDLDIPQVKVEKDKGTKDTKLKRENEQLKKQIQELQEQIKQLTATKKVVKKVIKDIIEKEEEPLKKVVRKRIIGEFKEPEQSKMIDSLLDYFNDN